MITGRAVVLDPMEWVLTRSVYTRALPQLNFEGDEVAAKVASGFCDHVDLEGLDWGTVHVVMPPAQTRPLGNGLVIAVEGYTVRKLLDWGIRPRVVVTDFDFQPEHILNCDCLVFGHAHGDNIGRFIEFAGKLRGRLVPTVQVWPRNCGLLLPGFTDGDRAVYLAYYMGARVINVYGFNKYVVVKRMDEVKRIKLDLAEAFIGRVLRKVRINFYP